MAFKSFEQVYPFFSSLAARVNLIKFELSQLLWEKIKKLSMFEETDLPKIIIFGLECIELYTWENLTIDFTLKITEDLNANNLIFYVQAIFTDLLFSKLRTENYCVHFGEPVGMCYWFYLRTESHFWWNTLPRRRNEMGQPDSNFLKSNLNCTLDYFQNKNTIH